MASSKCKGFLKKKRKSEPKMVISGLRKEIAYLKKTLVELSHQHSEHYKLVERFVSLETVSVETSQQQTARDETTALPSEQPSKKGGSLTDVASVRRISGYAREIEEIRNKLVNVSTRCQYLENRVAEKKDSKSDEQASSATITELRNQLKDALEKNKQWLEYDQQREAYVRAIMARMLWLEKLLNEANQARSQQHNEDHSAEREKMRQMQEHYERLLQKAKDELQVLRGQLDNTHQKLINTQNWYKEREMEVEKLKQQLQTERMHRESTPEDDHRSEDEEQPQKDETEDLHCRLDEARRRSASFELQANLFQKYLLNRHLADQEKIAELERQIKISSQDLEDEKNDCSYLKKQMVRVLKTLKKTKSHGTKQSKRDQQDCNSCEATHPPSQLSRDSPTSSPHSSLLNASFLECPGCQAEYPASHYRELMNHLEMCLD